MADSLYKPMYKVKPYFVIRKIKLPDCMYVVQPLHRLPALTSDDEDYQRALDGLEERQDKLFERIKELQSAIVNAGKESGLSNSEIQQLTETHVPNGIPQDVVVTTPPSTPPYPLLALYQYIKKSVPTCLKSFIHSSAVGRVSPQLTSSFNDCSCDNPMVKITVIWKEIEETSMLYAPGKQVPITGIANICRFLSRQYCPSIYGSLPPLISGQADMWLDSLSLSYIHGNAKEKGSVLRQMNSALGSNEYLVGGGSGGPTIADIVLYCVIGTEKGVKVTGNVQKWMKRCHSVPEMAMIPCLYLT